MNIKVVFDPGGIEKGTDVTDLLPSVYVLKPNEHEAELLTGIAVTDFDSARIAANKLKEHGATNIFITHGEQGAYLFTETEELRIPIPVVAGGSVKDATGCGDQATATLCVALQQGKTLIEAAKLAVVAGTLQFYKPGIQPLTQQELTAQL
jgi:ribokinase